MNNIFRNSFFILVQKIFPPFDSDLLTNIALNLENDLN